MMSGYRCNVNEKRNRASGETQPRGVFHVEHSWPRSCTRNRLYTFNSTMFHVEHSGLPRTHRVPLQAALWTEWEFWLGCDSFEAARDSPGREPRFPSIWAKSNVPLEHLQRSSGKKPTPPNDGGMAPQNSDSPPVALASSLAVLGAFPRRTPQQCSTWNIPVWMGRAQNRQIEKIPPPFASPCGEQIFQNTLNVPRGTRAEKFLPSSAQSRVRVLTTKSDASGVSPMYCTVFPMKCGAWARPAIAESRPRYLLF